MLSTILIRQIIESGFDPLRCSCTEDAGGALTIKVFEPDSGRVDLLLRGVSTESLTSMRAISNFIGELRVEMRAGRRAFASGFN